MANQTIPLSSVKRACRWCAFVADAQRGNKCKFELEWLAAKRDYSFAVAWH